MGVDYVIDLECEPKEALGVEGIVGLVKAKNRALTVLKMARDSGDKRPPSQITFGVMINRNGNIEESEVAVQALLDQASALDRHHHHCVECPANEENENGYGCYRSISYPIEADTERWLLSRLPDQLDQPEGYLLQAAMKDFGWDGAQAADMRTQGETFFRLREAPVRTWPGLTISSDQIFHMLFHVGHLTHEHNKMLCFFFGLISVGDEGPSPRTHEAKIESGNAQQMIEFINTLAASAANEVNILIDG